MNRSRIFVAFLVVAIPSGLLLTPVPDEVVLAVFSSFAGWLLSRFRGQK